MDNIPLASAPDTNSNYNRFSSESQTYHRLHENLIDFGHHIAQEIYYDDDNEEEVQHFNYKQELKKKFSVSSIVGLGFSLMNVPFGVATTLSIGLVCGSSVTILWGWILFGIFSLFISLSLSEIVSKFPTSGGVYHFSSILASDRYSLVSSWFDGWYLIIGNLLMFVSCAFGGAQFILSMLGLTQADYKHDDIIVLIVFIAIVFISGLVNLKFQKHLEKFNKLCIYWTIYTILVADFLILLFATDYHNIKYVLTHFDASRSGWPNFIAFIIGGIQFSAMTFNGYGAIAAMSEEVKVPEKTIPKSMIYSIIISTITGLFFIIPLLSILPDLERLLDDNPEIFPIDIVFKLSTKSFLVSFIIALMIVGALTFATVGSLTTVSRTIYSFGRDHGLPFDYLWQQVDTMDDEELVPKNALLLAVGTSVVLGCFSLVSTSAFNAFVGCSVIAMNIANGIPILSSLMNKRQKIKGATFKLRKFGYIINILSCFFIVLTVIVLSMPPSRFINIQSMNYAFAVFLIFTILICAGYYFWGIRHFKGPLLDSNYTLLPVASSFQQKEQEVAAEEVQTPVSAILVAKPEPVMITERSSG